MSKRYAADEGDGTVSRRSMLLFGVTGAIVSTGAIALATQLESPAGRRAEAARVPAPRPAGRPLPGNGLSTDPLPADLLPRPAAHPLPHPASRLTPSPTTSGSAGGGAGDVTTSVTSGVPAWAKQWHAPIYSLDDFTRRCPTVRYPRRAVMLTIDDGPSAYWTPRYLKLLAKYHVRATFCMIGEQVPANRNLAREVVQQGHVIANHTWTHDESLPYRTAARIHSEIVRTSDAIHTATGFTPVQFRAPGGVWGPKVYAELARQRMMPLGWDVDPRDWALPGTGEIEHAMLAAGYHDIILCHDGGGNRAETYTALQTVIPALLRRGYEFVVLPAPQPGKAST